MSWQLGHLRDAPDMSWIRRSAHLLEDPEAVIQGRRVLHLRYRVRR